MKHTQNVDKQNKCEDYMLTNSDVGNKPVWPTDMVSGCSCKLDCKGALPQ